MVYQCTLEGYWRSADLTQFFDFVQIAKASFYSATMAHGLQAAKEKRIESNLILLKILGDT